MKTKEIQEKLAENLKKWQKIENAAVASTGRIMEKTENPLIRLVMEIISRDSHMHHQVQQFLVDSLETKAISLNPDELAAVSDYIEKHVAIERQMVGFVKETLEALKGRKMIIQEYLINYLHDDEQKHDKLLSALDKIKSGMYPYAS